MYEFGDYGDYRASNTGSDNNTNGYGFYLVILLMGLPIGFFVVYFIGTFLWLSWTR